jgi:hypothetical protein
VLLGDIVELRQGPLREALAAAEGVLAEIGAALGAGSEIVIVPGNHDHRLLRPWLGRRASAGPPPPLGLESNVDWGAGDALAAIAGWARPASVRVAYPGAWLRDDVYATHGHYADRHTTVPMFERVGAGAMARIVREPAGGPRRAEDYEAALAPIYAWLDAIAQGREADRQGAQGHRAGAGSARAWEILTRADGRQSWRRRAIIAAFPALIAVLNRAGLGPLSADLSGSSLRRGGLSALGEAVRRLDVPAAHVIFGHTHRAGPLDGDDRSEWVTPSGAELINAGSWVHEPGFLGPDPATSPYRAGFAVVVPAFGPPRLECLLDGTTPPGRD